MKGFTRALGVRCSHCHVGGNPLSTYDFASDENPNKGRAREMLRMLNSINEHLQKSSRAATNGSTCGAIPATVAGRVR